MAIRRQHSIIFSWISRFKLKSKEIFLWTSTCELWSYYASLNKLSGDSGWTTETTIASTIVQTGTLDTADFKPFTRCSIFLTVYSASLRKILQHIQWIIPNKTGFFNEQNAGFIAQIHIVNLFFLKGMLTGKQISCILIKHHNCLVSTFYINTTYYALLWRFFNKKY